MKLVAQVKLLPTPEQAQALKETMELANQACNEISETAFREKIFSRYGLQKAVYYDVRRSTGLAAQLVIRCLAKTSDSYRRNRKKFHRFKKHGAVSYDSRILTFLVDTRCVTIWTYEFGRILVPYVGGKKQLRRLRNQRGETDLVYRRGEWFLLTCCEAEEPERSTPADFIGVDLGVTNIAVRSDGKGISSKIIEAKRKWHHRRRKALQSVGTRSAKRRLRKLSGKQRRFQKDVNHRISKELVSLAKRTNRGIALEDLKGINRPARTRASSKKYRGQRMNWSFFQLRSFIEYKARLAGVPVVLVNPAYTSQMCSSCGHVAKANRPTQRNFRCVQCGFEIHADINAARNIRDRGIQGHCQLSHGNDSPESVTSSFL